MSLIFDITTLKNWYRQPVGIIRVELELLKYIIHNNIPCKFVYFSKNLRELHTLNNQQVQRILDTHTNMHHTPAAYKITLLRKILYFLHKLIKHVIPLKLYNNINIAFQIYKTKGALEAFKKIFNYFVRRFNFRLETSEANPIEGNFNIKTHFNKGDTFISIGLSWEFLGYELLYYAKKKWDLNLVSISYDVIFITSELYNKEQTTLFLNHFYYLNYLFDKIACISYFSESEFKRAAKLYKITKSPYLKTIHLGDKLPATLITTDSLARFNFSKDYILYVSTLEERKNHKTLLKAYITAYEQSKPMPDLVFIGMLSQSFIEEFKEFKDHVFINKKVHFLYNLSDNNLANLYKNCLFTVFPSIIEGWGLGAAESLIYGKVCLISSCPGLKEATRNLMPSIEANDVEGWMNKISALYCNPTQLKELEEIIKEKFKMRPWEDFSKEFIEFALGKEQ